MLATVLGTLAATDTGTAVTTETGTVVLTDTGTAAAVTGNGTDAVMALLNGPVAVPDNVLDTDTEVAPVIGDAAIVQGTVIGRLVVTGTLVAPGITVASLGGKVWLVPTAFAGMPLTVVPVTFDVTGEA